MKISRIREKVLRAYYLRAYPWQTKDVAFIVSSGRTGTAFLGQFFNVYEHVHAVHEPQPDMFDLSMKKLRANLPGKVIEKKILLNREEQYRLLKEKKKSYYIESNPFLALLIPELIAAFPHAKFVSVTRDHPSYLISAYNKSPDRSNEVFMYSADDHRRRLTPCDLGEAHYCKQWESWQRHERISWYWKAINEIIAREMTSARNVLRLRYEDFFNSGTGFDTLLKVLSFLCLPEMKRGQFEELAAKKVNSNPVTLVDSYSELPGLSDPVLGREITALRQKLGYIPT